MANEWGAVGSGGAFFKLPARSVNREVNLVSSPPESSYILSVWQGSAEAKREVRTRTGVKGTLSTLMICDMGISH